MLAYELWFTCYGCGDQGLVADVKGLVILGVPSLCLLVATEACFLRCSFCRLVPVFDLVAFVDALVQFEHSSEVPQESLAHLVWEMLVEEAFLVVTSRRFPCGFWLQLGEGPRP